MSELSQNEAIKQLETAVFGCEDQQTPGLNKRMSTVEQVLAGHGENLGVVHKVNVIWRFHVWLLCVFSGLAGSFLTLLVQRFAN